MSAVAVAIGSGIAGLGSAYIGAQAAEDAAAAQERSARAGMAMTQAQFDATQRLMAPFVGAGTQALGGMQTLAGAMGPAAQETAISQLSQSPQFMAMVGQGENAMLQNASATGGLRGGNLQGALAQFRPQMLSQLIDQQYSRLGGLTQLGQASASGQAANSMNLGSQLAGLQTQIGQAQAGGILGQGQAWANALNVIPQTIGLGAMGGRDAKGWF